MKKILFVAALALSLGGCATNPVYFSDGSVYGFGPPYVAKWCAPNGLWCQPLYAGPPVVIIGGGFGFRPRHR